MAAPELPLEEQRRITREVREIVLGLDPAHDVDQELLAAAIRLHSLQQGLTGTPLERARFMAALGKRMLDLGLVPGGPLPVPPGTPVPGAKA